MRLHQGKSLEQRIAERQDRLRQRGEGFDSDHFDVPTAKYVFIGGITLVVLFHVAALAALFFTP
ncbi:hypothetical protein [Actinocorallia longicatena]|uniref:Uncharacterized protein n=1 Tax=Actinocorallia longicatena TaxID=111803 RepID=A0ABP6QB35_9ACTN